MTIEQNPPAADSFEEPRNNGSHSTITQEYTTTFIAHNLGMTAQELNKLLLEKKVIFKQSGMYMLYADYVRLDLARYRIEEKVMEDGSVMRFPPLLVWTVKGQRFLTNLVIQNPTRITRKLAVLLSSPSLFTY